MTPGRLLYLTKRRFNLGLKHWYNERFLQEKILSWRAPSGFPEQDIPLHFLTSKYDWKMTLWMLCSLHIHTQHKWPIVIHEDGSLSEEQKNILRNAYTNCQVISRKEADKRMDTILEEYPLCKNYRERMPHGIKSFDIPQFVSSEKYLMIDPDVLFYSRPDKILDWANSPDDHSCWFNEDFQEPSPISPADALAELSVPLWSKVNTGLCLLSKNTIQSLESMENWLAHPALQKPDYQWRIEQTLIALSASQNKLGGLLDSSYEISPNKQRRTNCTARHYVGCVRDSFLREGISHVWKTAQEL